MLCGGCFEAKFELLLLEIQEFHLVSIQSLSPFLVTNMSSEVDNELIVKTFCPLLTSPGQVKDTPRCLAVGVDTLAM